MSKTRHALAALVLSLCGSCAPTGNSTLQLMLWGGSYIPDSIPARDDQNGEPGLENGWVVTYSQFLVTMGNFNLASSVNSRTASLPGLRVWDMHSVVAPVSLGTVSMLPAQRFDVFSFSMAPATSAATAGNVSPDDLAMMRTNGYSLFVAGRAVHPMLGMVNFAWGFTGTTLLSHCSDVTLQPGVTLLDGMTTTAQVTVHGEQLFLDDLTSTMALLRFDVLAAADADHDGNLTLDELAAVPLGDPSIPAGQYGTGNVQNVSNLRDYVTALAAGIGHYQGEGRCTAARQ